MPKVFKEHLLTPPHLLAEPGSQENTRDRFDDSFFNPVETLTTWQAPARPYKKKGRSYYTTVATLLVLISLIAFLAGERLLIGVLLALGFIVYVLNFIPPQEINYKLSTQGVTIGDHFYHWDELDSFWFSEKEGHKLLNILTDLRFPAMLIIPLGEEDQDKVKKLCARFLPFHEIAPKTLIEKWSESLQKHFPLERA